MPKRSLNSWSIAFVIPNEIRDVLKQLADREHVTMSTLLRRIVYDELKRRKLYE